MTSRSPLLPLALSAMLALTASAANYMSVQVRDSVLRAAPSPFGKPVAKLNYGDLVDVIGKQGAWMQVKGYGNQTGWLHQNTLTSKRLIAKAGTGQASTGASASEVALAGKGFNSDIEQSLRAGDPSLDFRMIEQMETWKVSEGESLQFLKDGGVRPQGVKL